MKDIFEFNHIDKSLSEFETETTKEFYKDYHKKYWCFRKSYKRFKRLDETIIISEICLMIVGTITGGITLNPVILGVVNRAGIFVTKFAKMKNYKEKIEMTKIAFTTYEKVVCELRSQPNKVLTKDVLEKTIFNRIIDCKDTYRDNKGNVFTTLSDDFSK